MATASDMPVSEHLKRIPVAMRRTVQAARRTVRAAAPAATELGYRTSGPARASSRSMHKIARYVVDGEQVAGIGVFPTHAVLFFRRGSELDHDDGGTLEGSGRGRFIRLTAPSDAERPALKRIVRKAFKLSGS